MTVLNTGKQPGTEVVQVYLQDPVVNHVRYWKRLVGFQKIFLLTGKRFNPLSNTTVLHDC